MWANEDETGARTSRLALIFSLFATALVFLPWMSARTAVWFLIPALGVNLVLLSLAWKFFRLRDRVSARKLFLFTLLHLPALLAVTAIFWRHDKS